MANQLTVIPAKAGIPVGLILRNAGNDLRLSGAEMLVWVPAFAGMTEMRSVMEVYATGSRQYRRVRGHGHMSVAMSPPTALQ